MLFTSFLKVGFNDRFGGFVVCRDEGKVFNLKIKINPKIIDANVLNVRSADIRQVKVIRCANTILVADLMLFSGNIKCY